MTAPPEAITTPRAFGGVAGIDEKMHEDREESKEEIQLGQKSVVQIGTSKNWQAVSDRNKRVVHGGASRDRTAPDSENRQVIESTDIAQMPKKAKTPAMPDSLYVYCTVIRSKSNPPDFVGREVLIP